MRIFLTSLLMATLVFGASASMALGAESEELYPGVQSLPGPTVTVQRHASTVEEGVLRGAGALRRGVGEAEYYRSLAAINREYARRLYIQNREQATEAYFNMKRTNRYARQELAAPRATAQDLARYAKERLPAVLSEQEYDRENGQVIWPAVLLREEFAADRSLVDALLTQRSNANAVAPEIDSEVAGLADQMLVTLQAYGQDLSSRDFIGAMKFLKSLKYEAIANPTQATMPNDALVGAPLVNSVANR